MQQRGRWVLSFEGKSQRRCRSVVWVRLEFIIFLTYLSIPLNSKILAHLFGSKMFVFSFGWHVDDLSPFFYQMNPLERVELLERPLELILCGCVISQFLQVIKLSAIQPYCFSIVEKLKVN